MIVTDPQLIGNKWQCFTFHYALSSFSDGILFHHNKSLSSKHFVILSQQFGCAYLHTLGLKKSQCKLPSVLSKNKTPRPWQGIRTPELGGFRMVCSKLYFDRVGAISANKPNEFQAENGVLGTLWLSSWVSTENVNPLG